MLDMKGLEGYSFDECYYVAQKAEIEGVIVPFFHINHLIENKKAVNHPKDQLDVIYLKRSKRFWKKMKIIMMAAIETLIEPHFP